MQYPAFDFPTITTIVSHYMDYLRDVLVDAVDQTEQYTGATVLGSDVCSGVYRFDGTVNEAIDAALSARDASRVPGAETDGTFEVDAKPFVLVGYNRDRGVERMADGTQGINAIPVAVLVVFPYRGRDLIQEDAEVLDLAQDLVYFYTRQRFYNGAGNGAHGYEILPSRGGQVARQSLGFRQVDVEFYREMI